MERIKRCKGCGEVFPAQEINRKGYCNPCAQDRLVRSIRDLERKEGEFYERWVQGIRRSISKKEKRCNEG